jgi:hypothetical protein
MATPEDNVEKGLFEQDPRVDQLRPEPSAPPSDVVILEGLAGKSDREGWARLYFNRELTYYAEFRREDIVFTEAIPPDQPPMLGLKATRVGIKKDAVIEYTRTTRARTRDEFDLDVQLEVAGPRGAALPIPPPTSPILCHTVDTCRTDCDQVTCDTCRTRCNQPTCSPTCNTCQTRCNQPTCNTCQTRCNQPTCQGTCDDTCGTCDTCNRHVFTCGGGRCL